VGPFPGGPSPAASRADAGWLASAYLSLTLFMLSADRLFVSVDENKIKYGYFLVLGMWLFSPAGMFRTAMGTALRLPKAALLVLLPLSVSVAQSTHVKSSILWALWLGFDLFTVVTVYAFLTLHRFSVSRVQASAAASLALIAAFGLLQFVSIYGFGHVVFDPQFHLNTYRINGLSGWPHFLNIFAFLLLPLVLLHERPAAWQRVVLVALVFVLVQSTAKTGWVLFVALGALLAALDRKAFARVFLLFLLPATAIALLLPIPSFKNAAESVGATRNVAVLPADPGASDATTSAAEKVAAFASDLDIARKTTSGADRMLINRMGLDVWMKHPWFGVGPNAYDAYVFTRFDEELPGVNKRDANGNINAKNENIWIEFLSENGLLFTAGFAIVVAWALWVPGWRFSNALHLGAWMALLLYFCISAQVSQNGLLTMVYAVFGIYLYGLRLPPNGARP